MWEQNAQNGVFIFVNQILSYRNRLREHKKDEFSRQEVAKGVAQQYRPSSYTISIAELLKNGNGFGVNLPTF